jgi:hypothetical protein
VEMCEQVGGQHGMQAEQIVAYVDYLVIYIIRLSSSRLF